METWDSPWLPCISMLFDDRGKQTEAASRSKKREEGGDADQAQGTAAFFS